MDIIKEENSNDMIITENQIREILGLPKFDGNVPAGQEHSRKFVEEAMKKLNEPKKPNPLIVFTIKREEEKKTEREIKHQRSICFKFHQAMETLRKNVSNFFIFLRKKISKKNQI